MQLETETRQDALIVRVIAERIDAAGAIDFKDSMANACKGGEKRIILDLSTVSFLDSSGLGAVVAVMKLLGAKRKLELACLMPNVEKVFRLTRMDKIFSIHNSMEDAFKPCNL